MAHHEDERTTMHGVLDLLIENGLEGMADAITTMLNEAMKIERSSARRAEPGERSPERLGYANGFKPKRLSSRAGLLDLQIPQVRSIPGRNALEFYPQSLERGIRSERALKLAIAEMYLKGVSTRKVVAITEQLCGLDITSSQVSRATAELDEQLEAWRQRSLGETPYLIVDARCEKVRHGGSVVDCAVLITVGVRKDGKRTVLGRSVSLSEAEVHWRAFFEELHECGLYGVQCITTDDHKGIKAALAARFPGTKRQRCQFHLQQNAQAYVPRQELKKVVARDIRGIFGSMDRRDAEERLSRTIEKYREPAPKLAEWMERAIPGGLTVFDLPEDHRRRLRTTNVLERLNREIKRPNRRRNALPERGVATEAGHGADRRGQRRVGEWTCLSRHGERVGRSRLDAFTEERLLYQRIRRRMDCQPSKKLSGPCDPINDCQLRHVVRSYVDYYHADRTHLGLKKDASEERPIEPREMGEVVAFLPVGGLHHRYTRELQRAA